MTVHTASNFGFLTDVYYPRNPPGQGRGRLHLDPCLIGLGGRLEW
jgi:hypothetical protein